MYDGLDNLFEKFSDSEVPNFFEVMEAINDVTDYVINGQSEPSLDLPKTVCELNGRVRCSD